MSEEECNPCLRENQELKPINLDIKLKGSKTGHKDIETRMD